MKNSVIALIALSAVTMVSCSSDEPWDSADAITMNMTVGDSETVIGGSDVYINSAVNFTTSQCAIADLGKKGGLDKNLNLSQVAQEVAVEPGHYYQIMLAGNIRTVAGARACPIENNYYNVYVDSWIYDKDKEKTGAKISYTECYPDVKELPDWNSNIELTMKPAHSDSNTEVAEYTFDKGCVIDDNISVYDHDGSYMKDKIHVSCDGNRITFSNDSWTPGGRVEVIMLIRYESAYTQVVMNVSSSKEI